MTAALPPGPRAPAFVQTLRWAREPVAYMEEARARFGPVWTSRLVGFPPLVHVSDPEVVREVFTAGVDRLRAGTANRVLEPILGRGSLFLLDGERHLARRKIVMPPFARSKLGAFAETFARAAGRAIAAWPRGRPFDALAAARRVALDVILEAILGIADPSFGRDLARLLDGAAHPILLLPRAQVDLGPLTPWAGLMRLKASVDTRLQQAITRARAGRRCDDVLALLARATDEDGAPLSSSEVRDELMTLIVAGHDTVATALAWALHHLAAHPAEADRARRDEAYLDAAILESLRLTPVLPIVARTLTEDTELGGRLLPAGARVAPNAYLTHREPSLWDRAGAFRPARFMDRRPDPYAFFPFGGGARRCIGMRFSLLELRVVLSRVLDALSLHPAAEARPVRRGVTLAPSGGAPLILRERRRRALAA